MSIKMDKKRLKPLNCVFIKINKLSVIIFKYSKIKKVELLIFTYDSMISGRCYREWQVLQLTSPPFLTTCHQSHAEGTKILIFSAEH